MKGDACPSSSLFGSQNVRFTPASSELFPTRPHNTTLVKDTHLPNESSNSILGQKGERWRKLLSSLLFALKQYFPFPSFSFSAPDPLLRNLCRTA